MYIERKTVAAMTLLHTEARLTIPAIPAHAEAVIPKLLAEAEASGMAVVGPCIFIYEGCDGKPDTEFTLTIGFPVDGCTHQGQFVCREVPEHECLATQYHGAMAGIGDAWGRFTPLALSQGVALQPVGREVYLRWVDMDSPENLTELQIPLQK